MSKVKTNKKFRLNPIVVVALVLCALIAVYCGTTAWITGGAPVNPLRFVQLQDFDYVVEYSTDSVNWSPVNGTIDFDYSEMSSLKNLQVRIKQVGNGVAFARVRIIHEWTTENNEGNTVRLQSQQNLPFIIDTSEFYDNRAVDGYVYHVGDFEENIYYSVIKGFDVASFDSSALSAYTDLTLTINITVDAVQFNRYQQFWGIENLPWRSRS